LPRHVASGAVTAATLALQGLLRSAHALTERAPAPTRASRSSRAVDRHGHLFAAAVVSL